MGAMIRVRRYGPAVLMAASCWCVSLQAQTDTAPPAEIDPPAQLDAAAPPASSISSEDAIAAYRTMFATNKPRCSEAAEDGTILVCGNRDYSSTQRLPFPRVARVGEGSGPVRGEVPRAANLSIDGAGSCGVHGPVTGCTQGVNAVAAALTIVDLLGRAVGLIPDPVPSGNYEQQDLDSQSGGLDLN